MTKKYPTVILEFPSVNPLVNFLLTAQAAPEFGPGSELYELSLNRIHVRSGRSRPLFVRVQAHQEAVQRLGQMAVASGGKLHTNANLPDSMETLSTSVLLRRLALRRAPRRPARLAHLLVALWGMDDAALSERLAQLWDLGASGLEVAFLQRRSKSAAPSHLVRIYGLRHVDAFLAWMTQHDLKVEVFTPTAGERGGTQYYVGWGYQFPVPGIERLAEIEADVVLIRPAEDAEAPPAWLSFGTGEVQFFRMPHEVVDLELAGRESPVVQVVDDRDRQPVPLELALIAQPETGQQQLWQVDRQIDRLRRQLRDLEINRARLVGQDSNEVYFAYRFDQDGTDQLNPLLLRMMQLRLSTLSNFNYAFCRPERGAPYHLLIASRPQQQLGFSLQLADRTYYQPVQWRRWGVNLFLPLGMELAPSVDSNDAIPLLQRFLERSAAEADGDALEEDGDPTAWDAVLWEPGLSGRVVETRIKRTAPLLDQFRLLNAFQCQTARQVEEATRRRLQESQRAARAAATDELDAFERELVELVQARTRAIETKFQEMDAQLSRADKLLVDLEPRVAKVTQRLLQKPQEWVDFVSRVMRTHSEVSRPALAGYEALQQADLGITTGLLRTLTPQGRDLVARAQRAAERLNNRLAEFDQVRSNTQAAIRDVEQLGERTARVLAEISQLHNQLGERLRRVRAAEQQAAEWQREIDEIHAREQSAQQRLEQMRELRAQAESCDAETRRRDAEIQRQEAALTGEIARLGEQQALLQQRAGLVEARLEHIRQRMAQIVQQQEEMQRLHQDLQEHADAVDAHAEAVRTWQNHRGGWESYLQQKGDELSLTIERMHELAEQARDQNAELAQIERELQSLQERLVRAVERSASHVAV